jgi:hypothetical protein
LTNGAALIAKIAFQRRPAIIVLGRQTPQPATRLALNNAQLVGPKQNEEAETSQGTLYASSQREGAPFFLKTEHGLL